MRQVSDRKTVKGATMRIKALLLAMLFFVPLVAGIHARDATDIETLAAELTDGKEDRAERIASLQIFVRDEIREVATRYG